MSARTIPLLALLALARLGFGQGAYVTADPTDRYYPGAVLGNPALAIGSEQLVVGIKTHQMGATGSAFGLRTLFFSYASPSFLPTGALVTAEIFDSGNYRRSRLLAGYATSPLKDLDVGLSLGLHSVRYSGFEGEELDAGDPLLASPSKLTAVIGLGLRYRWNALVVGLGLEDLNRPNIAVGDDAVRLPWRYSLGLSVELGSFTPFLQLSNRNTWLAEPGFFDKDMTVALGLRMALGGQGFLSAGYMDRAASLGGGVMVSNNLQTMLRYEPAPSEMADFSYGSTTLALSWDLVRHRDRPIWKAPPAPGIERLQVDADIGFDVQNKSEFFILSPISDLHIVQMRVEREIDFDVLRKNNQKSLPVWTLIPFGAESGMARTSDVLPDSVRSLELTLKQPGIELPDQWGFSSQYFAEMQTSRIELDGNRTRVGVVSLSGGALDQALVLRDVMESPMGGLELQYLVDPRGRVAVDDLEDIVDKLRDETRYSLDHREYRLWIVPIHMENYAGDWQVDLVDEVGSVVKRWSGTGLPPDYVSWDWRRESGAYIAPGAYSVQMEYSDGGEPRRTRPQYLQVELVKRSKRLEINSRPPAYRRNVESKTFFLGMQGDGGK